MKIAALALALALIWPSGSAAAQHGPDLDPTLGYRSNVICTAAAWKDVLAAVEADEDYSAVITWNQRIGKCLVGMFQWEVGEYRSEGSACVGNHKVWMIYAKPDAAGRGPGFYARWNHPDCNGGRRA